MKPFEPNLQGLILNTSNGLSDEPKQPLESQIPVSTKVTPTMMQSNWYHNELVSSISSKYMQTNKRRIILTASSDHK
eukprot:1435730-Amphidinium_carterae.1